MWRMGTFPGSPRDAARVAKVSHQGFYDALNGECKKLSTLWAIASVLGLKWIYLFDLELKNQDFHRAVVVGEPRSGR
jgi:hypothetical protein